MTTQQKVWFITGTSRGFGREWAVAALERGDRVAATARDTATLADLADKYGDAVLPIRLDIDDRAADFAAVKRAHDHFGRLDVIVNNAGYGQLGFAEEVSEQEARAQFDTNFFGALWITQAALPYLREQGSGRIIQVSSIGGVTAFAGAGMYNASKFALEGFSQSLAWEVAPLGIQVTLVEPGSYATGWRDSTNQANPVAGYDEVHETAAQAIGDIMSAHSDPAASAVALLKIVDAEHPPLRAFLGHDALAIAKTDYEHRLATWEQWQPVAVEASTAKEKTA